MDMLVLLELFHYQDLGAEEIKTNLKNKIHIKDGDCNKLVK
jgi:hypothetical protein